MSDVLRLVDPGSDEFVTESYVAEIEPLLGKWSRAFRTPRRDLSALAASLDTSIEAPRMIPSEEITVRSDYGIHVVKRRYGSDILHEREPFLLTVNDWLGHVSQAGTSEFEIFDIQEIANAPLTVRLGIR